MIPSCVIQRAQEETTKLQAIIDNAGLKVQGGTGDKEQLIAELDAAMESCSEATARMKVQIEQAESFKK